MRRWHGKYFVNYRQAGVRDGLEPALNPLEDSMYVNGVRHESGGGRVNRVNVLLVSGLLAAGAMVLGGTSPARSMVPSSRYTPAGTQIAKAAGAETLDEHTNLRLTEVKGNKIAGQGQASGTVAGAGSAHLTLVNGSRAEGEFSGGSSGGSVVGKFVASYRVSGAVSYFTGTVTSLRGKGRYTGAHSEGIKFSGSLNRVKFTMSLTAAGKWHK
jgi:hypothetical protein